MAQMKTENTSVRMGSNWTIYILVGMQNSTLENSLAVSYIVKHTLKYDPAIRSCIQMCTGALFTTAKTWKQPKYPATGE